MQKLIWQNSSGEEINLTSGSYGITNWEGFSNTSLNIQSQQVPFQDGGVFLDALMEQRELTVTLAMQDNGNLEERYRMRRELIHALNPKLGEGYLIYTNDFISKRIKCVPQIPLFETHNSNDSGTPKASLSWTAFNPYWEDVEKKSVALTSRVIKPVFNDGEVPTEMEIDLFISNAKNPKIENLTTGKAIELNGTFDDNINININMGKKTVTSNKMAFTYKNIYDPKKIYYSKSIGLYILVSAPVFNENIIFISKDGIKWDYLEKFFSEVNVFIGENVIAIFSENENIKTTDGETWETFTTNYTIIKACYSKTLNKYFATRSYYEILASDDLENWEIAFQTQDTSERINSVCCSNSIIVAVGSNNYYTSSDGETWNDSPWNTEQPSNEIYAFYDVIYAEEMNLFCAKGAKTIINTACYGSVAYSSDGLNWNYTNLDELEGTDSLIDIVFLGGIRTFYISSPSALYKSSNGIGWTKETNIEDAEIFENVSVADYLVFVSYKTDENATPQFVYSMNGNLWQTFIECQRINKIAYSEKLGIYCTWAGSSGYSGLQYVCYSYDCIKWVKTFEFGAFYDVTDICYSGKIGRFFIASDGEIYSSTDGINWEQVSSDIAIFKFSVSEKLGMVLGVTSGGGAFITYDGLNWEEYSINDLRLYNAIYSEKLGIFCACAYKDSISEYGSAISTDGINWTFQAQSNSAFEGDVIFCVSENLSLIVLASSEGILSSSDGLNWESVFELSNEEVKGLTYSEDLGLFWLTTGTNILTSPDALNWEYKIEDVEYNNFSDLIYAKSLDAFVINAEIGEIITSIETVTNIISSLEKNSDMSLSLILGNNDLLLTQESGGLSGRVSFRQKYIGV